LKASISTLALTQQQHKQQQQNANHLLEVGLKSRWNARHGPLSSQVQEVIDARALYVKVKK
jgi:DNA-binding MurR/RpiR family transcriptional regulator